jgi:lipopolysaccharide export system protein LptA
VIQRLLMLALCLVAGTAALAQGADIALGTQSFDRTQPVEVTADELSVDQSNGQAVFDGNVLVVQGEVRLSAGKVTVEYSTDGAAPSGVSRLVASDGVTFVTPAEAIEAQEATYSVADGTVRLSGDVILTQGQNAIAGESLTLDLNAGSGRMEGRVRTVFTPGGN